MEATPPTHKIHAVIFHSSAVCFMTQLIIWFISAPKSWKSKHWQSWSLSTFRCDQKTRYLFPVSLSYSIVPSQQRTLSDFQHTENARSVMLDQDLQLETLFLTFRVRVPDASLNISASHIASTPSTFKATLQLMCNINYLLTYLLTNSAYTDFGAI